jgi:hypothetical protein
MASKMAPSEVAELVLNGVQNDRFWIVTHPSEVAQLVNDRTYGLVHTNDG